MGLNFSEIKKKFEKVKLIVSDVDGTLIDNNGLIPEENLKQISLLSKRGIKFTVATQRVYSSVIQLAKKLEIDIPIVTLNGTYIRNESGSFLKKISNISKNRPKGH